MRRLFAILCLIGFMTACGKSDEPAHRNKEPESKPSTEVSNGLREALLGGCASHANELKERYGEEKIRDFCACVIDESLGMWGYDEFAKKGFNAPEVQALSVGCAKSVLKLDVFQEGSPQ